MNFIAASNGTATGHTASFLRVSSDPDGMLGVTRLVDSTRYDLVLQTGITAAAAAQAPGAIRTPNMEDRHEDC
jgi:hypothetical protein